MKIIDHGRDIMKKNFFKICAVLLGLAIMSVGLQASAKEYYWYCKRNKEHRQPSLDRDLAFVEQNGGIYIDRRYGDECEEKVIYLTFDVGYENGNVSRILDVMRDEGVRGSFFILGNVIKREPELVERMVREGHIVCNHTVDHKNLVGASDELLKEQIIGLERAYSELTGKTMSKLFRPPEGTFDEELLRRASSLGYRTVFWSFAYADWDNNAQMSESAAMDKILSNLHNGEIMLLHPTSATNAKIMKSLISALKEQGYRFATLDEIP